MDLVLEKFRCFGEPQVAKLAPITILVGENSTGKSTFMAALRYILEFWSGSAEPSFNKDPFFLGGYKTIAHYRGGKYGRDSNFSIALSESFSDRSKPEPELFARDMPRHKEILLKLTFGENEGEAAPVKYEIRLASKVIAITLVGTNVEATVEDTEKGFSHVLTSSRQQPRFLFARADFSMFEYFLQDFLFVKRNKKEVTEDDLIASKIIEEGWELLHRLRNTTRTRVLAIAPVRTRPQRNYDPTRLSQSSEGDLLIGRLGRIARKGDKQWESLKARLEEFGQTTGLFDSISVRKLGNSETNPFQIHVRKSGREANIIDVGYGVSQILPLFIMLTELDRNSTLLIQQPEVHLHPSAQAALGTVLARTSQRKNSPNFVVETHSDFIVDRIRLAVREKLLGPDDVKILFFSKSDYNSTVSNISLDEEGNLLNAPDAYRNFFVRENLNLLGF